MQRLGDSQVTISTAIGPQASQTPQTSQTSQVSQAAAVSTTPGTTATAPAIPNQDAAIVTLSGEQAPRAQSARQAEPQTAPQVNERQATAQAPQSATQNGASSSDEQPEGELTEEEKQQVEELKKRDREVRAHEQAHLAALGPYKAGGPSYTYQTGPDGKQYAIGGEVPVDVSPESDPESTVRKMQTIQRAALAPAEPSSADRSVAAKAAQLEAQARAEVAKERTEGESSEETVAVGDAGASAEARESSEGESSEPSGPEQIRRAQISQFAEDPICPVCGDKAEPGHSHSSAVA